MFLVFNSVEEATKFYMAASKDTKEKYTLEEFLKIADIIPDLNN